MKIVPFILLQVLAVFGLLAQSQSSDTESSDPEAMKLLEEIKNDYDAHESHLLEFEMLIEIPGEASQTKEGRLLQSGEKFELDIDDKLIVSDNESVWLFLKNDNEVQINDADFGEDGEYMSPNTIFKLYTSDDYIFGVFQHLYEEGQAVTQIEAKPRNMDSEYSKMRLTIIDNGTKVKRFKIFSRDGSRYTMSILSHDKDLVLPEGRFVFDPSQYQDIIIEDLRF